MEGYERIFAEINLDAIGNNIRNIKKHIKGHSKIMAVVKADGYGHGAIEVAKTALENGAEYLGVAIIEEALALRRSGIEAPIIILGANFPNHMELAIENNITQTVFSLNIAKEIQKKAEVLNKTAKVQIKIDSGMGRIGFACDKAGVDSASEIFKMNNILVTGIYTHLSSADENKDYTYMQYNAFNGFLTGLKNKNIALPDIHISNSAAVVSYEDYNHDIVRTGIIIYGLYPYESDLGNPLMLETAMSLKSKITYIKTVPANISIGYGAAFTTKKVSVIATVGAGYGDGYPRLLSGVGRVLINGEFAPIAGRICMDQFMVDITNIQGVSIGDEVVLIGAQGNKEVSVYEIAKRCNTITHDVVCMIGKRVPRKYLKNGTEYKTVYL